MKNIILVIFLNFVSIFILAQTKNEYTYLFLGHPYMTSSKIDCRIEELNKTKYDQIWLGGDVCQATLLYKSTLEYIQTHLNINAPHNYWTFGNHDRRNGNLEMFEKFTGKKTYYSDNFNGITSIIIDTNLDPSDCENLDKQYKMICNVTDTIQKSTHLIMLTHFGLWSGVPGLPEPNLYAHTNYKYWNSNCDSTDNGFLKSIYPKLVEVKKRGVQVICIMGDMGGSAKKFERISNDSIVFIGSGIDNMRYYWEPGQWWTKEKDNILELYHNIDQKTITWKFKDLDSLMDVQHGYKYLQKLTFDDYTNYPSANVIFVNLQDFQYKLNNLNDSLIVLDIIIDSLKPQNNEILIENTMKSLTEVSDSQIQVYSQLYNDENLLEENIQTIDSIPTTIKFYQYKIPFNYAINSANRLKIYFKSKSSTIIQLNNIMVKYLE